MKIRLFSSPTVVPYDTALERLRRCAALVDEYMRAQREWNTDAAHAARLGISLHVPPGVYRRGDEHSGELYAVFGIQKSTMRTNRERIFKVPHVRVHQSGELIGKWAVSWLIESDGFLCPIARDGYHGPRFVRVGEIVHG